MSKDILFGIKITGDASSAKKAIEETRQAVNQQTAELRQKMGGAGKDIAATQAGLLNTARIKLPDPTAEMRTGISRTSEAVTALQSRLAAAFAVGAVVTFVRNTTQEFSRAEAAYRGLEAVANSTGLGIAEAQKVVSRVTADGLITVSDASKALQNLLARGYDASQAEATLNHLKDSAAFNRAAHLSLSEAVLTATEGLKNENSILVDNAGVTKNVSVIWKEYADSIGTSVDKLTTQQKIQAEVNGIMRETAAQSGNAAEAAKTLQGEQGKLDSSTKKLSASIGQALAPAMKGLVIAGQFAIDYFVKPVVLGIQGIGVAIKFSGASLSAFFNLVKTHDLRAYWKEQQAAAALAIKTQAENEANLKKDALNFDPRVQNESVISQQLVSLTQQRTFKVKLLEKDQIDAAKKLRAESIKETISGYDRLANAIHSALDKSFSDEKTYLQQAKALRDESNKRPKDASIEGQALAMLDLLEAEAKLRRLRSDSSQTLEDVQAQAKAVRDLAGNIDNQARAHEAVKTANLAEADALEKAAAGEKTRQKGLQEQYAKTLADVAKLKADLTSLTTEDKTIPIKADISNIDAKIAEIKAKMAELAKGVDVPIRAQASGDINPQTAAVPAQGLATGGPVVGPGSETSDSIPIMASRNEFMLNAAAHRYWGTNLMRALNNRDREAVLMRLRPQLKLAAGGPVSMIQNLSLPGAASIGSGAVAATPTPVNLTLPGGGTYAMQAMPDVVAELKTAVAREALKRGSRN